MMTALMISLAKLIMGMIFIGGPLIFLIALLHVRDNRKSIIDGIACKGLNSPDLRGLVAANTKCALLSKRCTVEVDIWNCSNERIWDVIEGLRANLPSSGRLVVNGIAACSPKAIFLLEIRRITRSGEPPSHLTSPNRV
jgi:hypothetical protein